MFKDAKNQNDDFFYEKLHNLKSDSLNVSNVENNSVAESLISKEDNFIQTEVLNLINSPLNSVKVEF